jgi:peptidoglycan/LPS O-acetylase OafA/YrhL
MTIPSDISSYRVQAARGLACLLLVTYHVIGSDTAGGIHAGDHSGWRLFTDFLLPIRMPLFTFLSGFVYAYKPVSFESASAFIQRKIIRLLIPLVVATIITFAALALHSALSDGEGIGADLRPLAILHHFVFPLRHLWFLQALLGVLAVVVVLELSHALATIERFLIMFVLALVAFGMDFLGHVELFSIGHVSFLLPFFLLGLATNRFRSVIFSPVVIWSLGVLFLVTTLIHYTMARMGHAAVLDRRALVAAAMGMSAVVVIVRVIPPFRALQWVGHYSFAIYLYHVALLSFVFLFAEIVGIESQVILLMLGLASGLTLPIVLERVSVKSPLARLLLLGQAPKPATRQASPRRSSAPLEEPARSVPSPRLAD